MASYGYGGNGAGTTGNDHRGSDRFPVEGVPSVLRLFSRCRGSDYCPKTKALSEPLSGSQSNVTQAHPDDGEPVTPGEKGDSRGLRGRLSQQPTVRIKYVIQPIPPVTTASGIQVRITAGSVCRQTAAQG